MMIGRLGWFTCIYICIVYVHICIYLYIYWYICFRGDHLKLVLTWDHWANFWWNIWTPECPGWKLGSINELYVRTHLQPKPHLVLVENHFGGCNDFEPLRFGVWICGLGKGWMAVNFEKEERKMLPAWVARMFSWSVAVFLPQYLGRFLGYLLFHQIYIKQISRPSRVVMLLLPSSSFWPECQVVAV